MTTWTRKYIAAGMTDDPSIATDMDVYIHQNLYQIGNNDEYSTFWLQLWNSHSVIPLFLAIVLWPT